MPEVYQNYTAFERMFSDTPDYVSYPHDMMSVNNRTPYSPYSGSTSSQGTGSMASPMSTSLSPLHGTDYITLNDATVLGDPQITILVQPIDKFRFRYKSEMIGTHGSLVGANSNSNRKKSPPTVELHNFPGKAIIRCTLVTSNESLRIPHAHRLVRREGNSDRDDPHDIEVSAETGYVASFHGMGIIHTAKKHIRDELIRKMRAIALESVKRKNINATLSTREEVQIKADAEFYQKKVNLNSVALCFQAFTLGQNDIMTPITDPVYSNPINNLKSALTGELKICRIDKYTSSCEGGEEVFIFVEKVGKKNIKIKFYELIDDREVWHAYGRFTELDVHHQYAIAFRTPAYADINITSPKEVFIQLERPTDGDCSEPIKFTYKPSDRVMGRKRQRVSYSGSTDLSKIMTNYQNSVTEEVPVLSSNDSREISKEINKMLMGEGCSSEELLKFSSMLDLESYSQFLGTSDDMLTSDGPSNKQHQDDAMFARNIVTEAIKSMQLNPKTATNHVQKLLRERSTYGDSPLHSALRYGQQDIAKYILMLKSTNKDCKELVNCQNSSGKTPLHYAVLQNLPKITKALLMLGADPNRFDDHGSSPLHLAVRKPEAGECVDELLSEKRTNIEVHNDAGWTALHLAAEAGSYHAVCSLIQAGADVNNTDKSYGRTVLHIAVEGGHKDIVEFLLTKTNVDVNKRNFSGNTALHSAVVYSGERAKELCLLLIKRGADPHIQNHNRDSENAQKQNGETVNVKIEVDTDEENATQAGGQTSFDLATNKPDILQLLAQENEEQNRSEACSVPTKQEIPEIDESQSKWVNVEETQSLAKILDKSTGWKKLVKHLSLEYLLNTFQQSSSPSVFLLNYIEVQGLMPLTSLEIALNEIGEKEAAEYVSSVLSK